MPRGRGCLGGSGWDGRGNELTKTYSQTSKLVGSFGAWPGLEVGGDPVRDWR